MANLLTLKPSATHLIGCCCGGGQVNITATPSSLNVFPSSSNFKCLKSAPPFKSLQFHDPSPVNISSSNLIPSSFNLRWCGLVLSRCLKSPTPFKSLQFQPKPRIWWGISEALKKVGALLLLTGVVLLSNPPSAEARIPLAIRYAIMRNYHQKRRLLDLNDKLRSSEEDKETEEEDDEDDHTLKITVVVVVVVYALFVKNCTSLLDSKEERAKKRAMTVLLLRFRYSWNPALAFEFNGLHALAKESASSTHDLGCFLNDFVRALLTYQPQFISATSSLSVEQSFEEALSRLTHLRVGQHTELIHEHLIDVTSMEPKDFNFDKVYAVITLCMVLKRDLSEYYRTGSKSVKGASEDILSIPWSNIESIHTDCKCWAEAAVPPPS